MSKPVTIKLPGAALSGDLTIPRAAEALVIFAHGSGSGRHSPRNRFVAAELNKSGLATLLMDLLTVEEERVDEMTRQLRFDIGLLAERVARAVGWARGHRELAHFPVGLFGASTGAAAALVAAARLPAGTVGAVVSRGGRPDLAAEALHSVRCPTLLIVGGHDDAVIGLNEQARARMPGTADLVIVPGATHLFEEPGALEEVARLAADWFVAHLVGAVAAAGGR